MRMMPDIRKSTKLTITELVGMTRRGKYTFEMRLVLPNQRPENSDNGLFIPDKNVAPGKKVEQLPIIPQVFPVLSLCTTCLNYKFSVWHLPSSAPSVTWCLNENSLSLN
jgi:hypothetical protein